jgi:Guanylate kinase
MESRIDVMNLEGKVMYIFLGSSGSGKSKLGFQLRQFNIPELISHTSREIRLEDGEKEGINYYYRSKEEILPPDKTKEEVLETEMIEFAEYGDDIYGLSRKEVEAKLSTNDIVYAVTELNGVNQVKERLGDKMKIIVIYIKIDPEEAERRMVSRGDKPEKIAKRLKNAIKNKEYDNAVHADYVIDNNGSFENSTQQLFDIVFNKQKAVS